MQRVEHVVVLVYRFGPRFALEVSLQWLLYTTMKRLA